MFVYAFLCFDGTSAYNVIIIFGMMERIAESGCTLYLLQIEWDGELTENRKFLFKM